jgi:DNA-binding MarR family transcriptional regulator
MPLRGIMTYFDLTEFLPYQLAVAAERVSRAFAEIYRQEFGLSIPEWRVLAHLNQSGAVSVRDIEARVGMEKSKVSRAVSRLERSGYVGKQINDGDRRLLSLSLTPEGRALVARILPRALEFQAGLVAQLGPLAGPLSAALQLVSADRA